MTAAPHPQGPADRARPEETVSVSTHILDTSAGRPAAGVAVELAVRTGPEAPWSAHGDSATDADGRCSDLPVLPAHTTHVRLRFAVEPYFTHRAEAQQDAPRADRVGPRDSGVFFPEVAIVFAVAPGEHYHVPLLLNPFGYSVYRGS
ncbi:5-hydroxyisourate hydrolase [Actinacidiphila yanglinensis]|uniref:5-hydroxyisourate hydrolase n=1 Tax=Actinacidiphila yanglinensis TaxID=310779 RepID=A0A1H5XLJ7_9ACTN|nr:hydroxyisourate hydrolase [Actinacidiphila yanglinensis]SEG12290.1 5-hydroxyisourate hydrolase [Actinacidiphila yanglinensis]